MPQYFLCCLVMACSALAATAVAQQTPAPTPRPPAQDAVPLSVYRSAWSGYRPFADDKVISWQDANDVVRRSGGWRTYLRESQNGQPSGSEGAARTSPAANDSARDTGAAQRHGSHNARGQPR